MKCRYISSAALLGALAHPALAQEPAEPGGGWNDLPEAGALAQPYGIDRTFDSYDADGQLIRRLVLRDGVVASETIWRYDGGEWAERVENVGGVERVTRRAFDGGALIREVTEQDGVEVYRAEHDYEGGLLRESRVVEDGAEQVSRYTYDDYGALIAVDVYADDALIAQTAADHPAPRVPIGIEIDLGGAHDSVVEVTGASAGFWLSRVPDESLYGVEPLEFHLGAEYAFAFAHGAVAQNELVAAFDLGLHHLVGEWSLFTWADAQRNPPANRELDLVYAPLAVGYDLLDAEGFDLDVRLSPVWHYRAVSGGGATHKLRTVLGLRGALALGAVSLSEEIEYLPNPLGVDAWEVIWHDAILRSATGLAIALGDHLTLEQSFVFERDLRLEDQADCVADPDNLLCDGIWLTAEGLLVLGWEI